MSRKFITFCVSLKLPTCVFCHKSSNKRYELITIPNQNISFSLLPLSDMSVSPTPNITVTSSICPSNATTNTSTTTTAATNGSSQPLRICLVGTVVDDAPTVTAARSFGVPVVTSETGDEFVGDTTWTTFFILPDFDGPMFEAIQATGHRILGPPALQHHQTHNEGLVVNKKRPVYNYSMKGVITCFTGIRNKGELVSANFPTRLPPRPPIDPMPACCPITRRRGSSASSIRWAAPSAAASIRKLPT